MEILKNIICLYKKYFSMLFVLIIIILIVLSYLSVKNKVSEISITINSDIDISDNLKVSNTPGYFFGDFLNYNEIHNSYEVGVNNLIFMDNWFNMSVEEIIQLEIEHLGILPIGEVIITYNPHNGINEIIQKLNSGIKTINSQRNVNIKKYPKFILDKHSFDLKLEFGICEFKNITLKIIPRFSNYLTENLGFSNKSKFLNFYNLNHFKHNSSHVFSSSKYKLDNINEIYVFSNIVEIHSLKNTNSDILGIIDISQGTRINNTLNVEVENRVFYKLRSKLSEHILIDLKDKEKRNIDFNQGSTIIKLIFRKS